MTLVDVFGSGAPHCSERCREQCAHRRGSSVIGEEGAVQAIAVRDRDAGLAGLSLTELPHPQAAENDVIVRVRDSLRLRLVPKSVEGDAENALDLSLVAWDLADSDHHLHHLGEVDVRSDELCVLGTCQQWLTRCE